MKKQTATFLFSFFLFLLNLPAQHTVVLDMFNNFTPDDLTINAGDSVTWDNQGGWHNVNGTQQTYPNNPEGFGNGNATSSPWTFSHTFTIPGVYDYRCDPHFNLGMTGKITVLPVSDVVITEINYNSPTSGEEYEFIELYNKGNDPIDMEGWVISDAVDFTFPAYTLAADGYVLIARDTMAMKTAFGITPFKFEGNTSLNNNGETIVLSDNMGNVMDTVAYSPSAPWPGGADGFGPSLSLCDVDADNNDAGNWAASITATGIMIGGDEIFATPGQANECPPGPIIEFMFGGFQVDEDGGTAFVRLVLSNGNADPTEVTLDRNDNSSANDGEDYDLPTPHIVTFDGGVAFDTQTVMVTLLDDANIESTEALILDITNVTNNGTVNMNGGQFTMTIIDDDAPITNALVLTGVYDTHPDNAGVKGIELKALTDIPDLSIFGVGSASNGNGSDGVEITLPNFSANEGDCIYIATDSTDFFDFFGFFPMATGIGVSINGNDAIELFENNTPIDVFGEISHPNNSTLPWYYEDGWVYRKDGTGPDGTVFQMDNWIYSGQNALDDQTTNATAINPFPECGYSPIAPTMPVTSDDVVSTDINTSVTIDILANDILPNPLTTMTVTSGPDNGMVTVNGLDDITYTPNMDFCGTDAFIYEVCDSNGCDEGFVTINVICPPSYPAYDIATVTSIDANGSPDSVGVTCQLQGIMHGINFQASDNRMQFALIDGTGGITVFDFNDFGLTFEEGDEFIVQGTIGEFNCVTQMRPDTLWKVSSGNPLSDTTINAFINETFESELIQLTNVSFVDPSEWEGNGDFFTIDVTNGTHTNTIFIDDDTDLANMPTPPVQGTFHVVGLGGQHDTDGTCDQGYQIVPRYATDFIQLSNSVIDPSLAQKIKFYPNPASSMLTIDSDLEITSIRVSNLLGQAMINEVNPTYSLDVQSLSPGIYLITFQVGESIWTDKFVRE